MLEAVLVSDSARVNGGAAMVALSSALGLSKRGVRVTVFAGQGPAEPGLAEAGVRIACRESIPYNRRPGDRKAWIAGLWDRDAERELKRLLAGMDPRSTVVHFHTFVDSLSGSVSRVPRRMGFAAVFTSHDYSLGCPYGGYFDYRRRILCPLEGLSARCWATNCSTSRYPRKFWRNLRLWLQRARGGAPFAGAAYVFVSEFSRRRMAHAIPRGARSLVLRNPIEVERAEPSDPSLFAEFAYLGRLSQDKGPTLLARAAMLAEVPAVFIGEGPEAEAVRAANPSAELAGWLPREAAMDRLRRSRALVLPSLVPETLGMAVQEAAAIGVPAVVGDRSASSETVEDWKTGLWFRHGDEESLAEALVRLKDAELAARLGREAYDRFWNDPPTLDRHLDDLIELYETMLEGRR